MLTPEHEDALKYALAVFPDKKMYFLEVNTIIWYF
jgi:hypothetical protein